MTSLSTTGFRPLFLACLLAGCSSDVPSNPVSAGGAGPSFGVGGSSAAGGATVGAGGASPNLAGMTGAGGNAMQNGGMPASAGAGNAAGAGGRGHGAGGLGAGGAPSAGGTPSGGGAAGTTASGGAAGSGGGSGNGADCTTLPPVTDYAAPGPFADAKMFSSVGPGSKYTLYRPDASLGKNGFRHPVATWGNGILTTPDQYKKLLGLVASHGFVVIACNDTQVERPCLSDGMDWLIAQDAATGPMQGKLDTTREVAIGYSWGGGAAIDASNRPNVKVTVSMHGMPPRGMTAFDDMHAPLLLFTSTGDSFVTASEYVTPNYQKAKVQTFYATLQDSGAGHLYVVDEGAAICIGSAVGFGTCKSAVQERGPTVAFLRYFACNDQNAKKFFYGDDCTLCKSPWAAEQRKPTDQWK